jgi:hypothetical protein
MAKPVWETKNPNKKSEPMSKGKVASARARAKAAGRRYPNLVDNMWAKKNG